LIVVDSSVWIDFLNGRRAPHVERLRATLGTDEIIVGDLMLCEVLLLLLWWPLQLLTHQQHTIPLLQ